MQIALISTAFAVDSDVQLWHAYNGYSDFHNFQLRHPQDWKPQIINEALQVFGPKEDIEKSDPKLLVREFEAKSYEEAASFYLDAETILIDEKDIIFSSPTRNLTARVLNFQNENTKTTFKVTLIKRGSLVVSFLETDEKYSEIYKKIYDSFKFTDDWLLYFDEKDNYSFLYPSNLETKKDDNEVALYEKTNPSKTVFSIQRFDGDLSHTISNLEAEELSFVSSKEVYFNEIENASEVIYIDDKTDKQVSFIIFEGDEKTYVLSNHKTGYIQEILASFEFTNLDLGSKQTVPGELTDVPTEHPNYLAISDLFLKGIIAGYEDGTFRPDGTINRAELAKIIVTSKTYPDPEKYNNCFKDVKSEWFANYVCYAKEQGWVGGYEDETFRPENTVSRVEAIKIILLALYDGKINPKGFLKSIKPSDIDLESWYGQYFIFAENSRLFDKAHIKWDDQSYSYYPNDNISRKEVAEMIYRVMEFF